MAKGRHRRRDIWLHAATVKSRLDSLPTGNPSAKPYGVRCWHPPNTSHDTVRLSISFVDSAYEVWSHQHGLISSRHSIPTEHFYSALIATVRKIEAMSQPSTASFHQHHPTHLIIETDNANFSHGLRNWSWKAKRKKRHLIKALVKLIKGFCRHTIILKDFLPLPTFAHRQRDHQILSKPKSTYDYHKTRKYLAKLRKAKHKLNPPPKKANYSSSKSSAIPSESGSLAKMRSAWCGKREGAQNQQEHKSKGHINPGMDLNMADYHLVDNNTNDLQFILAPSGSSIRDRDQGLKVNTRSIKLLTANDLINHLGYAKVNVATLNYLPSG